MKKIAIGIIGIALLGAAIALGPLPTLAGVISLAVFLFILQKPTRGVVLAAFFLPFERLGAVELSGLTVRISQLLIIVTFLSWLGSGFLRKKIQLPRNELFWFIIAFLTVNLLSLLNAVNLQRSLIVFFYTVFTLSVVLIVPMIIREKKIMEQVIRALLAGFVVVCVFGIYQFLGDMIGLPQSLTGLRDIYTKNILGFTRVQSTALEPLYFANYLLIPLGIIAVLFLRKTGPWKPWVLALLFALGGVNLVLTVSRGGYIALFVMLGILGAWQFRRLFTWRNIAYSTVIIISIAGLTLTFFSGVVGDFVQHTGNLFGGASYEERVETISLAWESFYLHPLVGTGVGGFGPVASIHPFTKPSDGWKIVNNESLELLAETGILGLLSFIMIVSVVFGRSFTAVRESRDDYLTALPIAFSVTFAGILVQYQTFSVLYIMHVWFLVGLMVSAWNLTRETK